VTRPVAAALALLVVVAGVRRLCPDVFADDSPETVSACMTLGIGHPPGDPLLILGGRLAAVAPVGGPALRINLLSTMLAACLAAGAWLLVAGRLPAPVPRYAAAAAALSLLLANPVLAQQAATAKGAVYTLNLLLLLGVLAAAIRGRPLPAALAAGLLAGHHWMTAAAFTPLLLGWSFHRRSVRTSSAVRDLALMTVCGVLGATLWLALPIRAASGPELNWGAATTVSRFAAQVSRRPFLARELAPEPATIAAQAAAGTAAVLAQLALPGLLLVAAGGASLLVADAGWLSMSLAAGFFGLACAAVYLHLPRTLFWLLPGFLLPCWLLAWVVAMNGAAALGSGRRYQRGLAVLLCVAAPLLQQAELDRRAVSRFTWSADLARGYLSPLPAGSGLVLVGDLDTFPVWEAQMVWRVRPDILAVNTILLRHDWYRRQLIARGAAATLLPAATPQAALAILLRDRRRAWFSPAVPIDGTPTEFRRVPFHSLFHLTTAAAPARFPRAYSYRGLFERLGHRPEPSAVMTTGYTMESLRNLIKGGMPAR